MIYQNHPSISALNSMLNRQELKKLITDNNLVENFINLDIQLTPNGFDLTAKEIFKFESHGALDFSNSERVLLICFIL